MRCWPFVVLALGAGRAWAQPEGEKTADEPAAVAPATKPEPREVKVEPASAPPDANNPDAEKLVVVSSSGDGFRFGSYGRVLAGSDLRGGKPEKILVVAHGPRIVEDSYLELDLSYGFESPRGVKLRPVITLAFDGTLFHDTGEFDAHPAIRNMFLDATITHDLTAWVGSRMYRGDDIYLFDYWPLDNQNTVGGGLLYRKAPLELAAHAGVNRLTPRMPCVVGPGCQYQTTPVPNPAQGATTVVQLNRQRMIASASAAYVVDDGPAAISMRFKVHGQVHALPSGQFKRTDGTYQDLPADSGVLVGAEVSLYGMAPEKSGLRRHLNLFTRYAKGLAAFDELAPPTTFGPDLKTSRASELSFGASGNWDTAYGNMMLGALSRRFLDATGDAIDPNNGWEYAIDARPLVRVAPDFFVGGDISYQARFPNGLNPNTLRAEDPAVLQLAPMAVFSPMGPSAYDRPQLRVVYRAAHLNEGALDLYVPDDPRHAHAWVHFLGVQAEWWFNSSTYH